MVIEEWADLFSILERNLETVKSWEKSEPDTAALRCEQSKHRTLAHLRACQEQWLFVALRFVETDSPRVKILHPWRKFDSENYSTVDWEIHLEQFIKDRETWLSLRDTADPERGGKWNGKPDTLLGLTRRLVSHESHHLNIWN